MKRTLLFIAYLLLSLSGNAQSANNRIRQMAQDGENLWLATNSGGLVKHNKQTGENTIYTTSNSGLCSDYLRSVTCHGGKVLVGSDNDGVSEFDGSTFKTYNEKNAPFKHSRLCFEEVIYDADGNMWLGGQDYIYKYDGTTWEDYTLPLAEWSSWLEFSVLKFSADSTLWFATEGPNFDGSVGYITKDKEIKTIIPDTHDIYGMDIDKQGRVWYSCSSCGLYCYDGSNRRLFAKNESAYYGLCVDDDNNVWFGCDNLLYKYDGTAFTSYQVPTDGFVLDLLLDGNAIWISVAKTGELFRFEDGQFESIDYTTETEENDDYLPFVEVGKSWVMARSTIGQDKIDKVTYWIHTEKVNHDGKGYYQMKVIQNNSTQFLPYLIREDNRKVYLYDTEKKNEFLLFDYSLKEGDTYETYSYSDNKMVTYKVLSVGDFTEGPEVRQYDSYWGQIPGSNEVRPRYLRKWVVTCIDDNNIEPKIWIEGAGSLEGPLANLYDSHPVSSKDYLAYVTYNADYYLPFLFHDTLNTLWYGSNLPTGTNNNYLGNDQHQLTYELEGDSLHIHGKVFVQCGHNNYAYFYVSKTDDPLLNEIHFVIEEVIPTADCITHRETDFYVPGFDPNMNYIVIDDQGVEYPVINKNKQMAYRPFIEEGKVWIIETYPEFPHDAPVIVYCYFDGDSIIDGHTCKIMKSVTGVNENNWVNGVFTPGKLAPYNFGVFYEQDKKVYYTQFQQQLEQIYDFTLSSNDSFSSWGYPVVVQKTSGAIPGFKGTYYDLWRDDKLLGRWLEGVGCTSYPCISHPWDYVGPNTFLLACSVGDEVIYYNEEEGDPYVMGSRKNRIDFTHIIKTKPKSRTTRGAEASLYGEYSELQLGINLNPLDDAYMVHITDESGKVVYEKNINAGNIVGLNIDISTYAEGRYTVTVENSHESFTGEFETQTVGIGDALRLNKEVEITNNIYNLQGQRLSTLRKGLNIVDGQKFFVK